MIPREILKKIRQIELRTNRIVTGSAAGARASARFTARTPAASKANPALNSIRTLKRRERRAPAISRRGNEMMFWPALTCFLSPRRGFQPFTHSVYPAGNSTNPVAGFSKDSGSVSPSPWGEGRDEGGRETNFSLAGFLFQPPFQFYWVSCAMKDRHNGENVALDRKVNAVGLESFQTDFARPTAHPTEDFRLRLCVVHGLKNCLGKLLSQAGRFIFIPSNGLEEFGLGFRLEKRIQIHHQPKRSRISALTCSKGIPRRGFFSNSARRRSSSAACSGVKSGSYPSSMRSSLSRCASSIRSASGRVFAALNNSVALMASIYSVDLLAQAGVFAGLNSAIGNRQSAITP